MSLNPTLALVLDMNRSFALVLTLVVCACDRGSGGASLNALTPKEECSALRSESVGAVAVIEVEDATPLCALEIVPTGITLRADPEGRRPDPASNIVRGPRGSFYSTSARTRGVIIAWDSVGRYRATVGRLGAGPGELPATGIVMTSVSSDSLMVFGGGRWTRFDATGRYVSSAASALSGLLRNGGWAWVGDSLLLVGTPVGRGNRSDLNLTTASGALVRSFTPSVSGARNRASEGRRLVALTSDGHFWSGPPERSGRYELDLWSLDGRHLRTIRRTPSWAPSGQSSPPLLVSGLNVDSMGLLWVTTTVPNTRFRLIEDPRERERTEANFFDVRIEVIDPSTGRLVATSGPVSGHNNIEAHPRQFPGTRYASRSVVNADGETGDYEIVRFVLAERGKR